MAGSRCESSNRPSIRLQTHDDHREMREAEAVSQQRHTGSGPRTHTHTYAVIWRKKCILFSRQNIPDSPEYDQGIERNESCLDTCADFHLARNSREKGQSHYMVGDGQSKRLAKREGEEREQGCVCVCVCVWSCFSLKSGKATSCKE